jgi:tRNA 2-thiocytidine biosynthesis protein TtcA
MGVPVVPCGCSQRTGTVRRSIRDMFGNLEREHPNLKESLLSAMGNIDPSRLLDPRFLNLDEVEGSTPELFPIVAERQGLSRRGFAASGRPALNRAGCPNRIEGRKNS